MAAATPTGALVALHHVSFRFDDGVTLFDSLDLSIDRTPTGIVGRNGIGKSLLAQLIAGRRAPSAGTIERHAQVVYVAQQHDDDAMAIPRTVAQIIALDAPLGALARLADGRATPHDFELIGDRWDLAERLRTTLDAAGLHDVHADTPAHALSGGQLARVALIGALLSGAGLLVLDEPTNHLDAPGRAWLRAALDGWRGGVVIVSHDRALLAGVQRIVELTPHGARSYGGNYARYRAQRDAEQDAAHAALDHARTERGRARRRLEQEHDTIQRHAAAPPPPPAGRPPPPPPPPQADAPVLVSLPGTEVSARRQLFTLERAQLPWRVAGDADAITWSASGPVRIALTGPNGCGKSTLLRMLAGELAPRSGTCTTHVSTAYLDQRLALLDAERSIVDQLGLLDTPLAEGDLRSRLALLQLDATRATQPARQLSGGERLKAALACALWRGTPAQLLLLDEPTNHLDLESVRAIEAALAGFPGAIVVASHDAAFLAALEPTHTMQWQRDGWRYEPVA
ncbi:ATP-binding cassette domain-containing protein [Burkholderia cenocepacia]|nr:ATP-binding cassette domain-containing protein [Burkholderia cenocepacia]MDC6085709.1 ATP-binding cassette domain-containing protein [Burkholderia cenocepacia]